MRRLLAILAAASLVAASPPTAAENAKLPKDRAALGKCLEAAEAGKRAPEAGIGTVQGPCVKAF